MHNKQQDTPDFFSGKLRIRWGLVQDESAKTAS
jgi:hypothetical protein